MFKKFNTLFKKDTLFLLVILIVSVLAARSLLGKGYFQMHDDLQMMRQLEMEKCFLDGQIPCRWVPDMGYGFGFPLFNYYPPLPYLIGQGIRVLGLPFTSTAMLTFALSFLASGVTMYYLAKEFFGRLGGVFASIFYIWAPYHALDVYVRGAMNESWAMVWFPLILWTSYRLIKDKKDLTKWIIGLALAWFGLFTSHNLMVLIFAPFFGFWMLLHLWREKRWIRLPHLVLSGLLSFSLAAFFIIPVLVENNIVQINTLVGGYYDYVAHYATLNQMFISRFWGYGASLFGVEDEMSFQIGHLHWGLSMVLGAYALNILYKNRKKLIKVVVNNEVLSAILFMLFMGWFSAFMAHPRSTAIWNAIEPLRFVQFPWRYLILTTMAFSFLAGGLVLLIKEKHQKWLLAAIAIFLIAFNWNYFKPGFKGPVTDEEKFSGEAWRIQQTAGIYDYLPVTAEIAPQEQRLEMVEVLEGEAEATNQEQGTNWAKFDVEVISEEAQIRLNILKFPQWKIFVDGEEVEISIPESEKWGRMHFYASEGKHSVEARLFDTWPRTFGNYLSLISWVGLLFFITYKRKTIGGK
jgi:hypothetical protein